MIESWLELFCLTSFWNWPITKRREGNENSLGSPLFTPETEGQWLENYRQSVRRLSTWACWSTLGPIGSSWDQSRSPTPGQVTPQVSRPLTLPLHVSSIVCVEAVREGALTKVWSMKCHQIQQKQPRAHTSPAPTPDSPLCCCLHALTNYWGQSQPPFLFEKIKRTKWWFSDGQKAPLIDNIRPSEDWWSSSTLTQEFTLK